MSRSHPHHLTPALAAFFVSVSAFLPADDFQLSLDEAVCRALECHPLLKAARSDIAIAQARLIDAGKLENPELEFSVNSQLIDGPDREGSLFVGYSQEFPVTDKLLRERDLGIADVRLACAEVREVERNLVDEVQSAYIEAVGARDLIDELERIETDSSRSVELAKQQLSAAQGSELDVASAETEQILASQDRLQAVSEYRKALARLRPLIFIKSGDPLVLSQNVAGVVASLRPTIPLSNPGNLERADITAAEVKKDRALTDEKLARSEALEDWEFAAGYEAGRTIDEPEGAERERFLGMGVKIPLPVRKKGAGRIAEARAATRKASHQLEAVRLASIGEVESSVADLRAAEQSYGALSSRVLPQLESRESKMREAYEQGLAEFSQIILLQQQQSRTRRALAEASLEKALAMARLQHALGTNPHLRPYDPHCSPYCPGTEPSKAPWAPPVLASPIATTEKPSAQATPVKKKKQPFQGWFKNRQ